MCGIAGIVATSDVAGALFDALTVLQHRGQDAAGMVTSDGRRLHMRKGNGLVRDVIAPRFAERLKGRVGVGHVRYPTAGSTSSAEAQPFYVNSPFGVVLAHNGNLTNAEQLEDELFDADRRHINTGSDSEILLNVFAHELAAAKTVRLTPDDVFRAVRRVHERCHGAYAVVAMIMGHGIVAFRDPNGIRPLVFGERRTVDGPEYLVASESVALDALNFRRVRDVAPGEGVFITAQGELHTRQCAEQTRLAPCIFELVYLARPDSLIDDISVYKSRLRMGEKLAARILARRPDHDIDVVIPVPDTSRTAALQLASTLGVKFREGFIKNRYIGRTFIMPGQTVRRQSVRRKLNPIGLEFGGKNVLLVDDSIVRGTTCQQIIQMARDAGAAKVYFASAAPPVRYPNVYGIDMPAAPELIAHGRTEREVEKMISADWLIYQELGDLFDSATEGNPEITEFEACVFTGEYVTGDVDQSYLDRLERNRNDGAKSWDEDDATLDL